MKKFFWRKVPLVIVPTALIVTPLLTFAISNKNFSNDKPSDANYEQEFKQIVHNQNLSLQEKINQLQDKLKKLGNHTLDVLKNLKDEIDNLKHLNECQDYLTNLNWETNLSNTLPSEFSKQKNQLFDLKLLKLKTNPKFTNVDFEYKLIEINDNEGTLTIEIKFKYQVKYVSTIQRTIHGFKKYTETNNDFKNMAGFLAALQNITNQNTVGLFPKEDKISALITEIYNIFPNSKKYLTLKVTNENTKISDFIDKDTNIIKLSLELIDDKTKKSQQFKNVSFKITNHTIYLNSNNQKQITFEHDLSDYNIKEILKIGFYQESQGVFRVARMPKTVEKVPDKLPSKITSLEAMFKDCANFNQDLSSWNVSNVTDMSAMFSGSLTFNGDISTWDVSNVTNMSEMFYKASHFNINITKWNVINVTNMFRLFELSSFNQNIYNWKTKNVTNMSGMFSNLGNFNQDLSGLDVSSVTDMSYMFNGATRFNQDLTNWKTNNVTDMSYMFYNAKEFNGNVSNWQTANVTDMSYMFANAWAFNQDLSSWNTSKVTHMSYMFWSAKKFNNGDKVGKSNKPLTWNTSNVTHMNSMFSRNPAFNQNISSWNVSKVTNMDSMFYNASKFNQNISKWNTSNVINMKDMFENASAFNQDLSKWNVDKVTIYKDFATNSGFANEPNKLPVKFRRKENYFYFFYFAKKVQ